MDRSDLESLYTDPSWRETAIKARRVKVRHFIRRMILGTMAVSMIVFGGIVLINSGIGEAFLAVVFYLMGAMFLSIPCSLFSFLLGLIPFGGFSYTDRFEIWTGILMLIILMLLLGGLIWELFEDQLPNSLPFF